MTTSTSTPLSTIDPEFEMPDDTVHYPQTVQEVLQLWDQYGLHTLDDYNQWCGKLRDKDPQATIDSLKLARHLDGSRVSPSTFWQACHLRFGTDCVANTTHQKIPADFLGDVHQSNEVNNQIAMHCNAIGFFDIVASNFARRGATMDIGEIGCGFGSFKQCMLPTLPQGTKYTGYDVLPMFPEAVALHTDGTFTVEQMLHSTHNVIYTMNVMQHVHPSKIRKYLYQLSIMQDQYNYLLFGYCQVPSPNYSAGTASSMHYGQRIPLLSPQQLVHSITSHGYVLVGETRIFLNSLWPSLMLFEKVLPSPPENWNV